jgi:hypothetical protein
MKLSHVTLEQKLAVLLVLLVLLISLIMVLDRQDIKERTTLHNPVPMGKN